MKKLLSIIAMLAVLLCAVNISVAANIDASVVYYVLGEKEFFKENLSVSEPYFPNYMPSSAPYGMRFVGWKDQNGAFVGESINLSLGENNLFAEFEKFVEEQDVTLYTASLNETGKKIYCPYVYQDTYHFGIPYEINGGFGPKEEITEGTDAPYTRFVSGQYNGRGVALLFNNDATAAFGKWNTTYEITVTYRIPEIAEEKRIHIQPVFGISTKEAQNLNSDKIKGNILKVGKTNQLTGNWNYDLTNSGNDEYYFIKSETADSSKYNIIESAFSDWRTVTFTIETGEEVADVLPIFGFYVNLGGGYNSNKFEVKNVTLKDLYSASVEYVVDGKTVGVAENQKNRELYYIDRVYENSDTHYFAGWYFDKEFKNQARSCFELDGKVTLYGKTLPYKEELSVQSAYDTFSGWEAHKHSLRENRWWTYRILVGAYGVSGGKYGDLLGEGQAHRHYGNAADGNTAVADENGLKHETRDRRDCDIWLYHPKGDYILRDANGEAFIVKPNTSYEVTVTYTFDNSGNEKGRAFCFLGTGLSTDKLLYSGEMSLSDLGEASVSLETFAQYGFTDSEDLVFAKETAPVELSPTATDKTVTMFITTPKLKEFKDNNLLQVLSLSDTVDSGCIVRYKSIKIEPIKNRTVVKNAGVSMIKTFKASADQALRYYFTYTTTTGQDVIINNTSYTVLSRGFLVTKGTPNGELTRERADGKRIIDINTTELYKCWSAKTDSSGNEELTFSCYVKDLKAQNGKHNDTDRIHVKGYIVVQNGYDTLTFYSSASDYTVKEVHELQKFHNTDEYKIQNSEGRELVWNIEFNSETSTSQLEPKLNTKVETMSPDRVTLFTSEGKNNFFLENGELVLRITKDPNANVYTTANSLTTANKMSYKYGYLEMRAKVPYQRAVWPSFWLQPDKKLIEQDDYFGEIDIFEVFGSGRTATFNLHKWYDGYKGTATLGGNLENAVDTGSVNYNFASSAAANDYHIYGFEWTPDYMKLYIDGYCYYEISIKDEDDYSTEKPGMDCFRDYYYICWNNWLYESEVTDGSLVAPVDYRIDYVRLYQNPQKEYIKIY